MLFGCMDSPLPAADRPPPRNNDSGCNSIRFLFFFFEFVPGSKKSKWKTVFSRFFFGGGVAKQDTPMLPAVSSVRIKEFYESLQNHASVDLRLQARTGGMEGEFM